MASLGPGPSLTNISTGLNDRYFACVHLVEVAKLPHVLSVFLSPSATQVSAAAAAARPTPRGAIK